MAMFTTDFASVKIGAQFMPVDFWKGDRFTKLNEFQAKDDNGFHTIFDPATKVELPWGLLDVKEECLP